MSSCHQLTDKSHVKMSGVLHTTFFVEELMTTFNDYTTHMLYNLFYLFMANERW